MSLLSSLTRRPTLTPEERLVAHALAGGRLAIGAGIWLAPRLTLKVLGFGSEPSAEALTLARMAGSRDLILGVWQMGALEDRNALRRATLGVAAADAADVAAFALIPKLGGPTRAAVMGVGAAAPATALGAWLVARLRI